MSGLALAPARGVGIGARRASDAVRGALFGGDRQTATRNGGGNSVKLHTGFGTIKIKISAGL